MKYYMRITGLRNNNVIFNETIEIRLFDYKIITGDPTHKPMDILNRYKWIDGINSIEITAFEE